MNIADRRIVLNLNANWQAINIRTVHEAFVAMMGGTDDNPPVKALDISYSKNENGEYDFNTQPSIIPVSWIEWVSLPIREYDLTINTAKYKLRVPSVVVSVNYHKVPKKRFRPTKSVLLEMQKNICGLTGKPITAKQSNLEHKLPRSLGGRETFENLIVVDKTINSKRGNKPYEEFGLFPIFNHREPAPIPVNFTFKQYASLDWRWFV
ncbi:MAG: hypothetical protein Q7R95_10660 [bacterium]|nr:hypothetical protein [bacterium]